jgi:hypothetical protein
MERRGEEGRERERVGEGRVGKMVLAVLQFSR